MKRRLRAALLVSLLLHLGLLLWMRWLPEAPAVSPAREVPIEVVVQGLAAARTESAPVRPSAPKPESSRPAQRLAVPLPASAASAASSAAPTAPPAVDDAPREVALSPRGDVVTVTPEPARGHTLHPEDLPSPGELLAAKSEQGRARVNGFLQDELASARVNSGAVSPYFHALRRELQAGLVHPPEVFDPNQTGSERFKDWARQMQGSWQAGAERYGATGVPYAEPAGALSDAPSQLDALASNGDLNARAGRGTLRAGARLREFADGRAGVDLLAVVELTQDDDGALKSAVMLQASGVKPFDAWVLKMAETSIDALSDAPPDGGARSVWEFRGRVSYLRSTKDFDAKNDAWYVLVMAPLGFLPGSFDEVLGTASYVDLRYPHYEATVRLLRAY